MAVTARRAFAKAQVPNLEQFCILRCCAVHREFCVVLLDGLGGHMTKARVHMAGHRRVGGCLGRCLAPCRSVDEAWGTTASGLQELQLPSEPPQNGRVSGRAADGLGTSTSTCSYFSCKHPCHESQYLAVLIRHSPRAGRLQYRSICHSPERQPAS